MVRQYGASQEAKRKITWAKKQSGRSPEEGTSRQDLKTLARGSRNYVEESGTFKEVKYPGFDSIKSNGEKL